MSDQAVLVAAQAFSDVMARCEYWRTHDAYPHSKWKRAWIAQQLALSNLITAAQTLTPKDPKP